MDGERGCGRGLEGEPRRGFAFSAAAAAAALDAELVIRMMGFDSCLPPPLLAVDELIFGDCGEIKDDDDLPFIDAELPSFNFEDECFNLIVVVVIPVADADDNDGLSTAAADPFFIGPLRFFFLGVSSLDTSSSPSPSAPENESWLAEPGSGVPLRLLPGVP